MRDQRGVTLFEVISCLMIVSVLSSMAVPAYQALITRYRFTTELSRIQDALKLAKSYAIAERTLVVFKYDAEGYHAFVDDGEGGGVAGDWVRQAGEKSLADCQLASMGIQIDIAESTFSGQRTRFTGKPGIKAGTLVLVGTGGSKVKIIINIIGRVRVENV